MIPDIIDQFRIKGKVAVVTGASRGIGEGIAIGLADAGAHVIITARDHERLKIVEKTIAERNRNCSITLVSLVTTSGSTLRDLDALKLSRASSVSTCADAT